MPDESKENLYQKAISKVNELGAEHLRKVTTDFLARSIKRNHAEDNPELQRLLKFEIERRAYGPGPTLDLAEPAVWMVVKTGAALAIALVTKSLENKALKPVGYVASLGIILNNVVEAFRFTPRFIAGLQGSENMALERWKVIEETGIDPFSATAHVEEKDQNSGQKKFSDSLKKDTIKPGSIEKSRTEQVAGKMA